MIPPIQITADEVNHIIYAYLLDSGFLHTAYLLKAEGRLEQSSHFNDHIPRGELVELLTKALLYTEVETHCKGDGLITDCQTPFSLLKRHECTIDPLDNGVSVSGKKNTAFPSPSPAVPNGIETPQKRKADAPADGDLREKRSRRSEETEDALGLNGLDRMLSSTPDVDNVLLFDHNLTLANGDLLSKRRGRSVVGPGDDTTNPSAILLLKGHEAEVFVCAWNPAKPALLATGSKDATVRIWDLPPTPKDPTQFASAPSEPPVVLKHIPDSDQRDITCLDWGASGEYLATGSYDSILRVWKTDGDLHMSHPQHQKGPIFAVRFSKSGRWLLSASLDGTACVWDVAERKLKMQFRCHDECCLDVDWLDDTTFASCGADKLIHIMQIGNTSPLRTFEGHTNEVNQIKFSPSKVRLASCSDDCTACIWSLEGLFKSNDTDYIPGLGGSPETKLEPIVLSGHTDSIGNIGWSPDSSESNEILATASMDGTTRIWNAITGECLRHITDHRRTVYSLAFSLDSKFIATAGGDGWLYVYDMKTGHRIWSWFAGPEYPGIYEIDWNQSESINRIAMCLESKAVGVVDVTRIPALNQQL